jgi:hypothetical protein
MARQNINIGTNANDGTGDTLRTTGNKINSNFVELYQVLGGDSDLLFSNVRLGNNQITFEGLNVNDFETTLTSAEPTKDNTITLPDSTGEVIISTADQRLYKKHLYDTKIDGDLRLHGVSGTGYYKITYEGQVDSGSDLNVNFPSLTDSDTLVFENHTQTISNKRLISSTLRNPRIGSVVNDSAGNPILGLPTTASAVNYVQVQGGITGNPTYLRSTGSDTNVELHIQAKGAGTIVLSNALRLSGNDYPTNNTISLNDNVILFTGTSGTNTYTLPRGTARNNMVAYLCNTGGSVARVKVDSDGGGSSYFGHTGYNAFTIQPKASIQAIYTTETTGGSNEGWYLVGLDSAGGLGDRVILTTYP